MAPPQARLVRPTELSARSVVAWRELAARAAEPNPFLEPDYVLPLARLAEVRGRKMAVLMIERGADMLACLPFYEERPRALRPLRTWDIPALLGLPLVDPEHASDVLAFAVRFLARQIGLHRYLRVHRLPADGPVASAMQVALLGHAAEWRPSDPATAPVIRRRPDPTYLDDTLRGQRRGNLRRRRDRLEELLGEPLRLEVDGDRPALERYLELEAAGWKGRAGTAVLSDPATAAFFRETCQRFAAAERLRVLSLRAGGTVVSMRCDLVAGTGLFTLKVAFAERYRPYSPGVLLEVASVDFFHAGGYAFMDSGTTHPQNPAFWLYPDSRPLAEVVVPLGGSASRTMITKFLAARGRLGQFRARLLPRD